MKKAQNNKILCFAISLSLFLISGCSMKAKNLSDTLEKYNRALKWGGYLAVSPLVEESSKETLIPAKIKEFQNKSIVEYSIGDASIGQDEKTATAVVRYSYIDQNTQNLKGFAEVQVWKIIKGKWYLSKILSSENKHPSEVGIP